MKSGLSPQALSAEIVRQSALKRDFVVPSGTLTVDAPSDDKVNVTFAGNVFAANNVFLDQLSTYAEIPRDYFHRLRASSPELFARDVNHWLSKRNDDKRMVRTLDGKARALLSSKYRPIDNFGLAEAVIPTLLERGITIESANITDTKLYIKAVNKSVLDEVKPGDVVSAGIQISNSEVGFGSVEILPLVYTLKCTNGLIINEAAMRRRHVGSRHDTSIDADFEVLTNETRDAKDRAFFLEVRDRTKAALDESIFRQVVGRLRGAAEKPITGDIPAAVDVTVKTMGMTKEEGSGILRYLAEGGDITQWGLSSAVTRYAQDVESYDRSSELERIGGGIIELPQRDWKRIAEAALN